MSHINREEVERRRERLLEEYGRTGVELVENHDEAPPDRFEEHVRLCEEGYTGGGYCWVARTGEQFAALTVSMPEAAGADPEEERVLLILGRGDDGWGVPGGGREGGETYEQAAVREVVEETGVDCEITDLYRVEEFRTTSTDPDDDRISHLLFVFFDADYAGGEIRVQPGELHGAAWFGEAPARLHPATEPKAKEWFGDRVA
jgi:8-oxo-dGTP pyrophosphatase MutT (NUDIX family)